MSGHQVFGPDSIGQLTKFSSTEVRLAPSTVTLGGLQYDTSTLSCLTNITGVGGLDTGSIQANESYYVYLVLDSNEAKLVCSLSSSAPTGFTESSLTGGFFTDGGGAVDYIGEIVNGTLKKSKVYWQKKFLTVTLSNAAQVPDLQFDNLEIGKKYRILGQVMHRAANGNATFTMSTALSGGGDKALEFLVESTDQTHGGDSTIVNSCPSHIFTATATSLYTYWTRSGSTGNLYSGNGLTGTHIIIEELPDNYEETTKWT